MVLFASTIPGGVYRWAGPSAFTKTQQNPVVEAASTASAGAYTVAATVLGRPTVEAKVEVRVLSVPDETPSVVAGCGGPEVR